MSTDIKLHKEDLPENINLGHMVACDCEFTGLIPGFHVNNVALIAVSLTPIAIGIGLPLDIIAGMIVSCGMVHTFLNYIPSALVGAPDVSMTYMPFSEAVA